MGLTREQIVARGAREIEPGQYVNLGIGLPTMISNFLPSDANVMLHSENGILGVGPYPLAGDEDPDLINAGKETVTVVAGAAIFDSALSFGIVLMRHVDGAGRPKLVKTCTLPYTGRHVVNRIITDLAVLDVTDDGLVLRELAPGVTADLVATRTEPDLLIPQPPVSIMVDVPCYIQDTL